MNEKLSYAISFVGFDSDLILFPIGSQNTPKIDKLLLLFSENKRSAENYEIVKKSIESRYKVIVEGLICVDILDFYTNFFQLTKIKNEYGLPSWVNLSSGPSPAINSLFYSFLSDDVIFVFVIRDEKSCYTFSTNMLDHFRRNKTNVLNLLLEMKDKKHLTIVEMIRIRKTSQATVSRDLNLLLHLGFISSKGSGKGRQKKEFYLSERGMKITQILFGDTK